MFTRSRILLVALVALLTAAGCQTAPAVPDEPERTVSLGEFFTPPADKVLSTADNIDVRGARTKFIQGHLRVDFKLYNNRGRRNVINYRVQWLDKDGMMTGAYDAWKTIAFEGQQEQILTVLSPSKLSVDYRLELQTN